MPSVTKSVHDEPPGDEELVAQVKSGSTAAFAVLVRRYQDRVFNTCWRICGHLEDARDVTQEAFFKVYEQIGSFRQDSGFYTWLFRIAVNQALTCRRRNRTRKVLSLDADALTGTQAEMLARQTQSAVDDQVADGAALQGVIVQALQALDEDHRAVVVLRDIEGMDYQRIGRILDVPSGTVKSRLHRARNELRQAIGPLIASEDRTDRLS